MNLLEKSEPKVIKLADDKDYTLPIINLTSLANIEKTMGVAGKSLMEKMNTEPMNTLRLFAYALLKENNPELTVEEAGKLVTINELKEFSETISLIMAFG